MGEQRQRDAAEARRRVQPALLEAATAARKEGSSDHGKQRGSDSVISARSGAQGSASRWNLRRQKRQRQVAARGVLRCGSGGVARLAAANAAATDRQQMLNQPGEEAAMGVGVGCSAWALVEHLAAHEQ